MAKGTARSCAAAIKGTARSFARLLRRLRLSNPSFKCWSTLRLQGETACLRSLKLPAQCGMRVPTAFVGLPIKCQVLSWAPWGLNGAILFKSVAKKRKTKQTQLIPTQCEGLFDPLPYQITPGMPPDTGDDFQSDAGMSAWPFDTLHGPRSSHVGGASCRSGLTESVTRHLLRLQGRRAGKAGREGRRRAGKAGREAEGGGQGRQAGRQAVQVSCQAHSVHPCQTVPASLLTRVEEHCQPAQTSCQAVSGHLCEPASVQTVSC